MDYALELPGDHASTRTELVHLSQCRFWLSIVSHSRRYLSDSAPNSVDCSGPECLQLPEPRYDCHHSELLYLPGTTAHRWRHYDATERCQRQCASGCAQLS